MAVPRSSLSLALAVGAVLALAGCSTGGGDTSASSAETAGAGAAGGGAPAPAAGDASAPAPDAKPAGAAPAAVVKLRVIRTAQVVLEVDGELAPAAAKVRALAQGLGGSVSSETTTFADGSDPGTTTTEDSPDVAPTGTTGDATEPATPGRVARPGQSLLVLRVPEGSLDRALTQLSGPAGVGKELSRSGTSQDVTGDLADLESRVATQRASVQRIRTLLARAESLRDIVLLESEVTKREAELEALQARQAALADRADLATLTVDLRTEKARAAVEDDADRNAFLVGLDNGWKALVASTTVVLTILGALLPLLVVALLVGGPALWLWRRRRDAAARPVPPTTPAPPAGPPGPPSGPSGSTTPAPSPGAGG